MKLPRDLSSNEVANVHIGTLDAIIAIVSEFFELPKREVFETLFD